MSPEQSQYIWRKTIPHIEVGMGSGVFTSHRSARFVAGLVTMSPEQSQYIWRKMWKNILPLVPPRGHSLVASYSKMKTELLRSPVVYYYKLAL